MDIRGLLAPIHFASVGAIQYEYHLYKKRQQTLGVCWPPFISLPQTLFNTNECTIE